MQPKISKIIAHQFKVSTASISPSFDRNQLALFGKINFHRIKLTNLEYILKPGQLYKETNKFLL